MKKIKIEDKEFEVIKQYKDGLDLQVLTDKYTEYFDDYDYILGDWAYNKLRLKGFCDPDKDLYNDINSYETIDEYIKNNCAYECRYFIIKRVNK